MLEVVAAVFVPRVEVVVLAMVVQSRPDDPSNILLFCAVEVIQAPQSVCLKDNAPENIFSIRNI